MPKIRLVRKDGGLLTLDATSFSISMNRSVPVIPIPVLAERMGIDTNTVATDIQIDCILVDDERRANTAMVRGQCCTVGLER